MMRGDLGMESHNQLWVGGWVGIIMSSFTDEEVGAQEV